jgi:hypothetical protein
MDAGKVWEAGASLQNGGYGGSVATQHRLSYASLC